MIEALIFDMNGVIINDEWAQAESWRRLAPKFGKQLTEEDSASFILGRPERGPFEYLLGRPVSEGELTELSAERVVLAKEILGSEFGLPVGLTKWFAEADRRNWKLALATGSRRPYTEFVLEQLKLQDRFAVVLTAEDCTHGKPNPEIYLKTAKALAVTPASCIVIEDTLSGIEAAKAAGMRVIGLASTYPAEKLGAADLVIETFVADPQPVFDQLATSH